MSCEGQDGEVFGSPDVVGEAVEGLWTQNLPGGSWPSLGQVMVVSYLQTFAQVQKPCLKTTKRIEEKEYV